MRLRWVMLGLCAGIWATGHAVAAPPDSLPPAQGPLVVTPPECLAPASAAAVFEGTLVDSVPTTARFAVGRILAGSLEGHVVNQRVDVRYGEATRFLHLGVTYLVGVGKDPTTGLFISSVREPAPLFGGDAVVGANDNDVSCPRLVDPARTLQLDGTPVDTGVLAPLHGKSRDLLTAFLWPVAVAFGVLLALVLAKHLLFGIGRALRDLSRPSATTRERRHRPPASLP